MIHAACELLPVSDHVGLGVFATEFIPRGTILWTLDPLDQVITPNEIAGMIPAQQALVDKYSYIDADGMHVLCWDLGRYMNHSCRPAARGMGEMEVAVRDIKPGDELTCEYGMLNLAGPFECACGSPGCRGTVKPDDFLACWQEWDREFVASSQWIPTVAQPLWRLVTRSERNQRVLAAIEQGWRGDDLPSIRDGVWPPVRPVTVTGPSE